MNKISIKRYFLYCIPVFFLILFVVIGNDQIALSAHKWLRAYDVVTVGNAVIRKPEKWVLSYEKKKTDDMGYIYGFFPIKDEHETSKEVVYIFKKVRAYDEVVFSELDSALKEKANNVLLTFSDNSGKERFEIFQLFGFKAIKIKNSNENNHEYSVSIPGLDLYVVTNNLESLYDFNINKSN